MNFEPLRKFASCSACGTELSIEVNDTSVVCSSCGSKFQKGNYIWNFIPTNIDWLSPMWQTWQQLQANGLASYQNDPEHNLAVVERDDIKRFSTFCHYHGLVLDIGCGPQSWPSYFDHDCDASYVGVDPLIDDTPGEYLRVKALGEFLPFRAGVFNHVLFSTTLDHFIDPVSALKSAARVCRPDGEIDIWLGEKRADAPKPAVSPEWYLHLQKPANAEDLFHIKRLNKTDFIKVIQSVGMVVEDMETHRVDDYRANHFYRLRIGG